MSTAYYIVLDHQDPEYDSFVNGKFLAQHAPTLHRICQELGMKKSFDDYVSQNPEDARAIIEECGGDPDAVEIPEEHWFPGEEGVDIARRLSSYIEASPHTVPHSREVLAELQEYRDPKSVVSDLGGQWITQSVDICPQGCPRVLAAAET